MLTVVVSHTKDRTEIKLGGTIDHTSAEQFKGAFDDLRATVALDLRDVARISSYGVGLLIRHLSAISRNHKVEFARCSETMVDQFQMLQFSNYGRITSFQARYLCSRCQRTESMLLEVKKLAIDPRTRAVIAPEFVCRCGNKLEVDDSLEFVADHLP